VLGDELSHLGVPELEREAQQALVFAFSMGSRAARKKAPCMRHVVVPDCLVFGM
jgi:hypothetical protein